MVNLHFVSSEKSLAKHILTHRHKLFFFCFGPKIVWLLLNIIFLDFFCALRPISISVDAIHFDWYIYTSKIKCRALKLVSLSLFNPAKDDGDDNDHIQISEIACRWVPAMESLGLPKLMCIHIVSRTKPPQPHQQPLFYVIYKLDFIKYKYEYFNFLPQRKWFTIYSNAY